MVSSVDRVTVSVDTRTRPNALAFLSAALRPGGRQQTGSWRASRGHPVPRLRVNECPQTQPQTFQLQQSNAATARRREANLRVFCAPFNLRNMKMPPNRVLPGSRSRWKRCRGNGGGNLLSAAFAFKSCLEETSTHLGPDADWKFHRFHLN